MKWARIINNEIAEVVTVDPETIFTPEVAALFQPVDQSAVYRARLVNGAWVPPPPPDPAPAPVPAAPARRKQVTPPEFKLLFTQAERLAIRQARAYSGSNPAQIGLKMALDDFYEIVDDPRLTVVDLALPATIDGLDGLVAAGILTASRRDEILEGVPS